MEKYATVLLAVLGGVAAYIIYYAWVNVGYEERWGKKRRRRQKRRK